MIKNHLKLAFRRMQSDRQGTLIHLLGLAVGMTGFLLLLQYPFFEKS